MIIGVINLGNINRKGNLFLLIMFIAIDVLSAQTLDFQTIPNNKKQFGFSFKKAFYSTNRNTTTLSGVYELSANIPLSSKLNIIGNIPYINTSYDIDNGFGRYSYSESFLGNIFIGLQTKPQIMENRISCIHIWTTITNYVRKSSIKRSIVGLLLFSHILPKSYWFIF